jgi:hypothetical protein
MVVTRETVCSQCANAQILRQTALDSANKREDKHQQILESEALADHQKNSLLETAKPLFIGSIPIAASKPFQEICGLAHLPD